MIKKILPFFYLIIILIIGQNILVAQLNGQNFSDNGNYFINHSLWEGAWWTAGSYGGEWFPTINNTADFGIDGYSWGQVRTNNYLASDDVLEFEVTFYLNSGGAHADGAYFGFGNEWVAYEGDFAGIQFINGQITFSERHGSAYPTTLSTIGQYSSGETIIFQISLTNNGEFWTSIKGYTGSFTPSFSLTTIRGLATVKDATVGHGFSISRIDKNGQAVSLTPVIFIPGIMGSPLYDDQPTYNELSPDEYIWANIGRLSNPSDLSDSFLDVLSLDEDGTGPANSLYNIKVAPLRYDPGNDLQYQLNQYPLTVYKGLFDYFINEGYILDNGNTTPPPGTNLFCFPYDWRKSIAFNSLELKNFIDDVLFWTGQNEVNIVSHSMGGLVFKQFIKDNQTYKSKIKNVVFAGTPHLGAPKILGTMISGYLDGFLDLIINPNKLRSISRNMPSAYQLFPSLNYYDLSLNNGVTFENLDLYSYCFLDPDGYAINLGLFNYYKNLTLNNGSTYNGTLITQAEELQAGISNVDLSGITVINIAGINVKTYGVLQHRKDFTGYEDIIPIVYLNGDGTVPLRSAETVNLEKTKADYYVKYIPHPELYNNNDVDALVFGLLKEPPEEIIGYYITTIPPNNYAMGGYQLRLSCPAILHAFDSQNNHTGPTSDSTYEQNIPDSYYMPTDLQDTSSHKLIILPRGDNFRVVINSQGYVSDFDFAIDDIFDGVNIGSAEFNNIPLYENTIAECSFDTVAGNLFLQIDFDGDGTTDSTFYPTIIPVELTSFYLSYIGDAVNLKWLTATELNNFGFEIERKTNSSEYVKIGFLSGYGTSSESHSYFFVDKDLKSGQYYYRLKQIDFDGTYKFSQELSITIEPPKVFSLLQNYPNPFNPVTLIKYSLATKSNVQLSVYDILGKKVMDLINNSVIEPGNHQIEFDASDIPSGVYFYRLQAGDFVQTKKMILLK